MVTAALEKLILSGKASFNTYVIGGAQKYILDVQSDRFIIITGITYFNRVNYDSFRNLGPNEITNILFNCITQLRVFSAKSNNLFMFRDNVNINSTGPDTFTVTPSGSVTIDTYLIHDSSVSFTFSVGGQRRSVLQLMNSGAPGQPPPFDYGKEGQPNAIPVNYVSTDSQGLVSVPGGNYDLGNADLIALNAPLTSEFTYDVNKGNPYTDEAFSMPLIHVQYVEILGNPTNIAATL